MKDDMAKKMLEKYYGKKFVEIEKVEKLLDGVYDEYIKMHSNIVNGGVLKRVPCTNMCACTGSCMPQELRTLEAAVYESLSALHDLRK